jgi:hypothetical protein
MAGEGGNEGVPRTTTGLSRAAPVKRSASRLSIGRIAPGLRDRIISRGSLQLSLFEVQPLAGTRRCLSI